VWSKANDQVLHPDRRLRCFRPDGDGRFEPSRDDRRLMLDFSIEAILLALIAAGVLFAPLIMSVLIQAARLVG
jgi:hypothetical protein